MSRVSKAEREFCIHTLRNIDEHIPLRYVKLVQKVLKKKKVIRADKEIRATRLYRRYDIEIVAAIKEICKPEPFLIKKRRNKGMVNSDDLLKKLNLKQ